MDKTYKDMLDESLKQSNSKLKISKDEAEKLKTAFDDPKFRDMFEDYLKEISDPKNREVTIILTLGNRSLFGNDGKRK